MTSSWPIDALIPHSGEMILLDEILQSSPDCIAARCTPKADSLFSRADGTVPAWVGIEYMAQAIAAFAGIQAKQAGNEIRLGFLLGTRHYHSNVTHFMPEQALIIRAECSIEDSNGLSVFNCLIEGSHVRVEASINVFQPQDVDSFLRENT